MTLTQLMAGHTPSASYAGWVTADDFVLAVDCGETPASSFAGAGSFAVAQVGVSSVDSELGPETQDKIYIRAGKSTLKTGNQRSFTVKADRCVGDAFQDFCLSHAVKYGTGSAVVRKYVYFDLLTGRGENGEITILVESDGGGDAGEAARVEIELKKTGSAPESYTWSAQ